MPVRSEVRRGGGYTPLKTLDRFSKRSFIFPQRRLGRSVVGLDLFVMVSECIARLETACVIALTRVNRHDWNRRGGLAVKRCLGADWADTDKSIQASLFRCR